MVAKEKMMSENEFWEKPQKEFRNPKKNLGFEHIPLDTADGRRPPNKNQVINLKLILS